MLEESTTGMENKSIHLSGGEPVYIPIIFYQLVLSDSLDRGVRPNLWLGLVLLMPHLRRGYL